MNKTMRWIKALWGQKPQQTQQLLSAYRRLIQDEQGRLLLEDIARYANLYNSSFCPNDALATAFNEGQRDLFLHITAMAQLDEQAVLALLLDHSANPNNSRQQP